MAPDFFKTDFAVHIYALIGAAFLLIASGWIGLRELSIVQTLSPSDFTKRFPGKQPWSREGLERRIKALEDYRKARLWTSSRHLSVLIIFGFIVPSALLFCAVLNIQWLFEQAGVFVRTDNEALLVQNPTMAEASQFVASQFMKSITDVMEIFQIKIAPITLAPDAYAAKFGLLGYHLFIGAFALAALYAVYVLTKVGFGTDSKIALLQERLVEMHRFRADE